MTDDIKTRLAIFLVGGSVMMIATQRPWPRQKMTNSLIAVESMTQKEPLVDPFVEAKNRFQSEMRIPYPAKATGIMINFYHSTGMKEFAELSEHPISDWFSGLPCNPDDTESIARFLIKDSETASSKRRFSGNFSKTLAEEVGILASQWYLDARCCRQATWSDKQWCRGKASLMIQLFVPNVTRRSAPSYPKHKRRSRAT